MIRTSTLVGLGFAERVNFLLLDEAEQLGLEVEADIADLVEEERAAVGGADDAGERRVGAGEGALAIAEELALEHVVRNRGAVEGDERAIGALGRAMDEAREHLLAGAGLAGEQDRQGTRGQLPCELDELDRLFGNPQALGVALEGFGRPQRRALLLVAAVTVERAGSGHELADGGERAAMIELGPRPRQDLPGFVAMLSEAHEVIVSGRPQGREGLGFGPPVVGHQPHAALAARRRAPALRHSPCPAAWQTPRAQECADGQRARGERRRSRGDGLLCQRVG